MVIPFVLAKTTQCKKIINSYLTNLRRRYTILDNLILKGQNTTFDELPSKYNISDVSFTLLNASLKRETSKELDKDKDLISLELITSDGKITNAGLLLSDQGLLTQSRVFCTRWKGVVKGSITGDAIDDKEYTGSIISLLENNA